MPPLSRCLRLPHGPDRPAAAADQLLPRQAADFEARVHPFLRDCEPARPFRSRAHRAGRGRSNRGFLPTRPAQVRTMRTAAAETADMLADFVADGVRTLAFVRSRRSAETIALAARRALTEAGAVQLAGEVAAYRAGYLPEDRRAVEQALRSGALSGLATTNALELGVDICGLDAVILAGWPGTRASLWQQAGRAGRSGGAAVAVLVARDDPLDTYLVHHPDAVFGSPVEATVIDPDNPYVLAPHLCAAAAELPLTDADLKLFGPAAADVVAELTERKLLRRREAGWFWTRREPRATVNIRGTGGFGVQIVEETTGQLLGTIDEPSAHTI